MRPPARQAARVPEQNTKDRIRPAPAATTGHAKLHRRARQAAQSGFHPDCSRSPACRPQYPNQRVEVGPVFSRLSDSGRTPRAPGRIFSDLRRNRDSGPGPDRTPLRSLRSRACPRGSDKRVPVAETWVKPNGKARPQRTSPYRPYDYQYIRLSEAKSPISRFPRGRISSGCATGSSSMIGGCKNSARLMPYCTGLRVPDMSGFPVWSPLRRKGLHAA